VDLVRAVLGAGQSPRQFGELEGGMGGNGGDADRATATSISRVKAHPRDTDPPGRRAKNESEKNGKAQIAWQAPT
jgi:hypothetical protein